MLKAEGQSDKVTPGGGRREEAVGLSQYFILFSHLTGFCCYETIWGNIRKKKRMPLPQGEMQKHSNWNTRENSLELPLAATPEAKKRPQYTIHQKRIQDTFGHFSRERPFFSLCIYSKAADLELLKAQVWEVPLSAVIGYVCPGWLIFLNFFLYFLFKRETECVCK